MFNYLGDRNGRHNLPGEPMLDPISGVLFALGLGLALRRLKYPAEFGFLAIFIVGLSAGIFSVDYESPQAQRAVPAIPAVYFFAALAVEFIWRRFQQASQIDGKVSGYAFLNERSIKRFLLSCNSFYCQPFLASIRCLSGV